ncbi:coiled-coil domain-containing protein 134-like [Daphnia pulex]|uniref:coiled-coil domain-containing protein 134-like n=1 Tax=Daphnia pulex TaxID=6669 RepID=UPI001EE08F78|nr:coiled-coil domain-containing protein 134-like [Daphnia pulex]
MAGHSNNFCYILLFCASLVSAGDKISPSDQTKTVPVTRGNINSNAVALFDRLFQLKRSEQKDAVQRIAEVKSIEKQRKLLELVITKIMEVLTHSRIKLESSGYLPESDFPQDESLRDALSSMIENTAFMGDLVLYLPDATKAFLKNNEWNTIFKWSLSICQQSVFLSTATKKMLHLVAQELNLVERESNYFNPYAEANRKKPDPLPENVEKKKVRKKISKGPSLSGSRLKNEL